MSLALSISLSAAFILLYWRSVKHLHALEQWFLWLVIVFIYTTTFDIGTHRGYYTVTEDVTAFLSLRLLEAVTLPAAIIGYTDWASVRRPFLLYIVGWSGVLLLLLGIETIWIQLLDALSLDKWDYWRSAAAWTGFVILAMLLLRIFRFVRLRRGVN